MRLPELNVCFMKNVYQNKDEGANGGVCKKVIRAYGLNVLLSHFPEVGKLRCVHVSSYHGNKFWASGWLLMEFFRCRGLPQE